MNFRGINNLALDTKGRMAMPARYRDRLMEISRGQLVVTVDQDRCLLVYPQPETHRVSPQREKLRPAWQSMKTFASTTFSLPPWIWTAPNWTAPQRSKMFPWKDNAGDHVVEANSGGAAVRAADDVAPPIPADDDAAVKGVAEHVNAALVIGFLDNVADLVEFDEVVVAFDAQGGGGDTLEEVVGDAISATVQVNRGRIGALETGDVGDGAVLDAVVARGKGLAVAAVDAHAATAEGVHGAAEDTVAQAAIHNDCIATQAPEGATGDEAIGPDSDMDAVAPGLLRREIAAQSRSTPAVETRNRKPLVDLPEPSDAQWELRLGPRNRFRVFYEVDEDAHAVTVLAIGVKDRDVLRIGREEFGT